MNISMHIYTGLISAFPQTGLTHKGNRGSVRCINHWYQSYFGYILIKKEQRRSNKHSSNSKESSYSFLFDRIVPYI